nr:translation initiation factor IF-2-like [Saimiri boliviensis boliviensis]
MTAVTGRRACLSHVHPASAPCCLGVSATHLAGISGVPGTQTPTRSNPCLPRVHSPERNPANKQQLSPKEMASSARQTDTTDTKGLPHALDSEAVPVLLERGTGLGQDQDTWDTMHTRVLTVGAENAAPAAATGPSAGTSGSPFPPPHRGEGSKHPLPTVGPGFGFGDSWEQGGGSRRTPPQGGLCHRAPGVPAAENRRLSAGARWTPASLRPGAVRRCTSTSRARRGPGPCRVWAGLSFPARRRLRHCPQCGTRPGLQWEPALRERHLQGAPRAEAASGGAGAAGWIAGPREGSAGQARAGSGPRPEPAGGGGKSGPMWRPQA